MRHSSMKTVGEVGDGSATTEQKRRVCHITVRRIHYAMDGRVRVSLTTTGDINSSPTATPNPTPTTSCLDWQ